MWCSSIPVRDLSRSPVSLPARPLPRVGARRDFSRLWIGAGELESQALAPSAEEKAVDLSLTEADSLLDAGRRRLSVGFCLLRTPLIVSKSFARSGRHFLRRKVELQKKSGSAVRVLPIRTELMAQYVREMQVRLREKKIGYKKESLREILKEVRTKAKTVTLKYRLPLTAGTPPARAKKTGHSHYKLVEPIGIEPTTS